MEKYKIGISIEDLYSSEDEIRPRDWRPRNIQMKGPLRLARLCILGMFLPAILVAGPIYLRYRVYSEQLYPLAASDQRLIDKQVSTTWCQRQVIHVNTTFNAYLINGEPKMKGETVFLSMTKHLVLEDDMKEYWGFYLLRGSSVTVSTCVRWPGASLTIIRGHKHLHECAFIGDDSSEELDELLEIREMQQDLINGTGLLQFNKDSNPSNAPDKMKRVRQGVHFHHESSAIQINGTFPDGNNNIRHPNSRELDANSMRDILKKLSSKTQDMKNKQKHHHREGVFKETSNIDVPKSHLSTSASAMDEKSLHDLLQNKENDEKVFVSEKSVSQNNERDNKQFDDSSLTSAEVLQDVIEKIHSLGIRGRKLVEKLISGIDTTQLETSDKLKIILENIMTNSSISDLEKIRIKRHLTLFSSLSSDLNSDDIDEDAAIEKEDFHPDGIADDRGTINETTLNDRSNSEFWSSFSSSEERLLECKGLILNLPLTPHHQCSSKYENKHKVASTANAITYRVPIDGYYFFVFNSENEVQPNYMRIQFDLLKTVYNTSNSVHACTNSTTECSLPFNFFSWERTVLELPLTGNESQWNEEYVVVSHCEPRTAVYLICIITVPLLILFFAFH
ncbi:hypothetical protein PV326_012702 [Microctonus aethiopoides]|nr:hypothetical protein PV326_012702 [Microctonus aethiopoides]